jgi:hypothetical protein
MDTVPTPVPPAADPAASLTVPVARPSNLVLGVIGGAAAAVIGAAIWAGITVATEYQIGYMAIGVGFLVGIAVRALGRGSTPPFGIVGGGFSLLGCALGNLLSVVGFLAAETDVDYFTTLGNLNVEVAVELMKLSFSPMDLLFYAIAAYFGFKVSMVSAAE